MWVGVYDAYFMGAGCMWLATTMTIDYTIRAGHLGAWVYGDVARGLGTNYAWGIQNIAILIPSILADDAISDEV